MSSDSKIMDCPSLPRSYTDAESQSDLVPDLHKLRFFNKVNRVHPAWGLCLDLLSHLASIVLNMVIVRETSC